VNHNDLAIRLEAFLADLPVQTLGDKAAAASGCDAGHVRQILETFRNEAHATLELVADRLRPDVRLLEVGAGLCLFSLFLRREGYTITALEPALGGYSLFDTLRRLILELHADVSLPMLTCPAQALNPNEHGTYDLVFSNNVIEHIPDWQGALSAMLGVLSDDGCMLHTCPNYSFPYEPHYGVPVLRRLPGLSKRLFLPASADAEIWDSLNFIAHRQVRGFARRQGCSVDFESGLIYKALARMQSDPVFRERHQGLIAGIADALAATGLLKLFRFIPPSMATPMLFEMRREGGES